MKKIFTIIMLIILCAFSLSAVVDDSISIVSKAGVITKSPIFSITNMMSENIQGKSEFAILQINISKFKGVIFLNVTAKSSSMIKPQIVDVTLDKSEIETEYNGKLFTLVYSEKKNIDAFSIGDFVIDWGDYKSDENFSAIVFLNCTLN